MSQIGILSMKHLRKIFFLSNLNVWKLLVYEKYFLHQISVNPKNSCLKHTYFSCANKSGTCSIPINKAVLRLNRVWLSQTDILAGKFFTSPFFLENILVLCQNVGISEKIPSPAPRGTQGGQIGVRALRMEKSIFWSPFGGLIFSFF